jgi:hypothetical protein
MCKIYNTIGSLTSLKSNLEDNYISDFKSLKEVINFQNSYELSRQRILSHHEKLIEQEKIELSTDIMHLETSIDFQKQQTEQKLLHEIQRLKEHLSISLSSPDKNFFQKITKTVRHWNVKKKIKYKENNLESEVKKSIRQLIHDHEAKINRHQFITSQSYEAVITSAESSLSELKRKKEIIDKLNGFIHGALGEQKIVKTLEKLSDDYLLINDFTVTFSPAIYISKDNDYIKSIQIDHILVGPSGVFLIETKNWSEKSLENMNLRSPVEQIKRSSFVLFMLLNSDLSNYHLRLDNHHWGDRKISIRNLIVFTNIKPKEEFQFVKILTLNELIGYLSYFKPIYSSRETQRITDFLLRLNEQKIINTK